MFDTKKKTKDTAMHNIQNSRNVNVQKKSPIIQRLVYNQSESTLHVNDNWKKKSYSYRDEEDNLKRNPILNGTWIDDRCKETIRKSYNIYNPNYEIDFCVTKKHIYDSFHVADMFSTWHKAKKKARKFCKITTDYINDKIKDEYYLYTCFDWDGLVNKSFETKAVLPPEDLCDFGEKSDVAVEWNDSLKSKACVLIAVVKEMAAAANSNTSDDYFTKGQKFKDFLVNAGFPDTDILNSAEQEYIQNSDSDKLYALIKLLHNFIQEHTEYKGYDLCHVNEKLYEQLGYTPILSCQCSFADLGRNIPEGVTLGKDKTYIFMLEEHAMAVKMLKTLRHADTISNLDEYFYPQNDPQNFNVDWRTHIVRRVFKR